MPIAGYSTEVAASKTAGDITTMLAKAGARRIMVEYSTDGRPTGVSFEIETKVGPQAFTLPVKPRQVLAVLKRQKVTPKLQTEAQAERVAWRIAHDWLKNQLALIETEMVSLDEVFFPWMITTGGATTFDAYIERGTRGELEQ